LKPFSTFEEWNPNPEVAEAARRLYVHTDNLELYVGLQAEAAKEAVYVSSSISLFLLT